MRYVSTRGETPPLDFVEVMLAGLARDGGLYVPETWPRLEPRDDRRLCRPALCRGRGRGDPAVRRRRIRRGRPRPDGAARPTAPSAIRRWRRSCSSAPSLFVLELFHGPTLAFKDLAMQLLARLMDHALPQRGERTTIVVATSGDTGGAAVEAFRGRDAGRSVRAVSARPHLRRAAADDDHGAGRQRPCRRHRRHFRRLPGDGEGDVQSPRLPRPRAAVRRQFHQLGAHRGAGGLLFHRGGRARRAAPQGRLHRADRQFRRRLRRLCRAAHGAAGRPAGGRDQRQRHPGAHARDRHL